MRLPRRLTKTQVDALEVKYRQRDPVAEQVNAKRYSSIEQAEMQIPWLRKRRRGR